MMKAPLAARRTRRHALARIAPVSVLGLLLAAGAVGQTPPQPPSVPPGVAGIWIDDTGKGAVEIAPCGDKLCGHIVWLKEPNDRSGKPLTDGYNPEKIKRQRAICGLQVVGDVQRISGNIWDKGWIYDPKEGKSYDVEIKLRSSDRLAVTGYLGMKFLSETFIWTRAPAGLARCVTPAGTPAGANVPTQATAR